MTSHALHTCKNEESLKRLLIADGVDPNLSGQVIEKHGLKIEKVEITVEGDAYFGGNHEHHHHYNECCKNRQESVPKKVGKCQKAKVEQAQEAYYEQESYEQLPTHAQESTSSKVFWWSVGAIGFAGVAVVALPVACTALGVYVVYKVVFSEPKQIAYHGKEEVQQEQHAQLETAKGKEHVSQWDKDQLEYQKHKLEMAEMKKKQADIAMSLEAKRHVWGKASEQKKLNEPYIDTELA